jgi:hypothetical protein
MQLASARALKAEAKALIGTQAPVQALGLSVPARAMSEVQNPGRLFALGVAPAGGNDFRLAIRVQRRAMMESVQLRRVVEIAKNEVDVRYVGRIMKHPAVAVPALRGICRPLVIGASVAHHRVTAGTLGGFVTPRGGTGTHILSNNHVLADENGAALGDRILQPGPFDGGLPKDAVATLTKFEGLRTSTVNDVDSAYALVDPGFAFDVRTLPSLGKLAGVRAAPVEVDTVVAKVGRTTGVTHGRVTAFDVDGLVVGYSIGDLTFDGQIEIEGTGMSFSAGGDSGSLIVDDAMQAAAQLFAGSATGGAGNLGLTYATPIQTVLDTLGVDLLL